MCTRTRGDRPRFIHADLLIHPSGTHICYSNNGSTDIGGNISKQGTPFAGSTGSEMAHLFYSTLNNKGYCDPASAYSCSSQAGYGLFNTGPFSNFLSDTYWSAEYARNPNWAWVFSSNSDTQNYDEKLISSIHASPVSLGDVAPVESAPDQQVFMFFIFTYSIPNRSSR